MEKDKYVEQKPASGITLLNRNSRGSMFCWGGTVVGSHEIYICCGKWDAEVSVPLVRQGWSLCCFQLDMKVTFLILFTKKNEPALQCKEDLGIFGSKNLRIPQHEWLM